MSNLGNPETTVNSFFSGIPNTWQNVSKKVDHFIPLTSTPRQFSFLRNIPHLRGNTNDPVSAKFGQALSEDLKTKISKVQAYQNLTQRQIDFNTRNIQGNSIPTYDNRNYTTSYYRLEKPFQVPNQAIMLFGAIVVIYFLSR